MIGIVIGLVSSVIIFSFYTKDDRAIREHKEKKLKDEKEKLEMKKKYDQEMQRLKNDPAIKKKKEQEQKTFKEQFESKIDPKDKKIIQQYLDKNRKEGKTDEDMIREASNSAAIFMGLTLLVCIVLVGAFLILNGVQPEEVKDGLFKFLGNFFPKIKEAHMETPQGEEL